MAEVKISLNNASDNGKLFSQALVFLHRYDFVNARKIQAQLTDTDMRRTVAKYIFEDEQAKKLEEMDKTAKDS